jgi:hypothetical protein
VAEITTDAIIAPKVVRLDEEKSLFKPGPHVWRLAIGDNEGEPVERAGFR